MQNLPIDQIIGDSPWTQKVRKRISQVANYRYSVLISGPSGTGKELVARAVHTHGPRADKPFIPVNCAALPTGLFASQLFGHMKGSFTGAAFNAIGCFRAAEGGTIFLDEIGELDFELQAKLLRVIQERKVVPVGAHEGIPVDVRIVAATNRDLEAEVKAGRFRLDLYYRLNVVSIETASLASRPEDIAVLARHFLAKAAIENGDELKRLSPAAMALLKAYDWPGNIRQLQNVLEGAIVFNEGEVLEPEAFPQLIDAVAELPLPPFTSPSSETSFGGYREETVLRFDGPQMGGSGCAVASPASRTVTAQPATAQPAIEEQEEQETKQAWLSLADVERDHIRRTLQQAYYNQSKAARLLGIDRKLLARKIKKFGLRIPTIDPGPRS